MYGRELKWTTVKRSKIQSSKEPISFYCLITTPNNFNVLPQDCFENNHEADTPNSTQTSLRKPRDNKSPNQKENVNENGV